MNPITLDPLLPCLNDHRPGGEPLFGTVMGVEAMLSAAIQLVPDAHLRWIESIENFTPFILRAGAQASLEARAQAASVDPGMPMSEAPTLECAVASVSRDGARVTHFRSRILFTPVPLRRPPPAPLRPPAPELKQANAAQIYSLFFHGPSYRVVHSAGWHEGRLYARLARGLPTSFLRPCEGAAVAAPRLIEFALQSAGLFEVAKNGRMRIPHSIARIERFSSEDVDTRRSLWAVAESSPGDEAPPDALDIQVADEDGHVHLKVSGYRTLPLPFDHDHAGVMDLHRTLSQ